MPTQLFSFVLTCLMLSACGTAPAPGNLSAAVTQTQTPRFPEIPPPGEFDTIPEHGDFRRLMVGPPCPDRCRPGPLAGIKPGASAPTRGRAGRESEEDIARMISSGAYPKFILQDRVARRADTVY